MMCAGAHRRRCCCALTSVVPAWGSSSQCRSTQQPNVSTTNTYDSSSAQAHRASPTDLSGAGREGGGPRLGAATPCSRHHAGRQTHSSAVPLPAPTAPARSPASATPFANQIPSASNSVVRVRGSYRSRRPLGAPCGKCVGRMAALGSQTPAELPHRCCVALTSGD